MNGYVIFFSHESLEEGSQPTSSLMQNLSSKSRSSVLQLYWNKKVMCVTLKHRKDEG